MRILLTNDDGIYAPGIEALEQELAQVGDVTVVAPATEQSGVGHAITFLSPLVCQEVYREKRFRGWSVEGSPADCVKLGVMELCPDRPDLVVSGINNGLNTGINVLYSGTVAAAIEGAFFGVTSIAVSLEYDEHADWASAARIARRLIESILKNDANRPCGASLFNVNIPTAALGGDPQVRVVPMGISRYGEGFVRRTDPQGRRYFWATIDPPPPDEPEQTDLNAIRRGHVTLTPLHFDLTRYDGLPTMREWTFDLEEMVR